MWRRVLFGAVLALSHGGDDQEAFRAVADVRHSGALEGTMTASGEPFDPEGHMAPTGPCR